ncbi:hypothetical protein GF312_07385 [Candidatus Poribacteria bacterium]|nr:hypothetical protein [Candidatus Poribacteria bacterium]
MNYRKLGNTGLMVSEVGMGCNRLGEKNYPDDHWVSLVKHAVELGVNIFDTSESYGRGRSEEMLGKALGNQDDVYIATKISGWRKKEDRFSAKRMAKSVEDSLKRLQRDCIDIYQLHSPGREDMEKYNWAEGMEKLKKQGKIRFSAVAVNSSEDGIWLMKQDLVQVLQITYNIFETQAEKLLFGMAEEKGVGLLCRMPLARGVLTGKFKPGEDIPEGYRANLDGERAVNRTKWVEDLRPLADKYEGGLTRMALHFSLTPEAISAIIPGSRTVEQLEENVSASNGTGLPEKVQKEIEAISEKWS